MKKVYRIFIQLIISCFFITPVIAAISVVDDIGATITLDQPAKRIISLSPGMTELIYYAGGLSLVKGVVSYSDYPEKAKNLPQIGSYNSIDIERVLSLEPDLIVAWESGNPPLQIAKLKKLGLNVYVSEPRNFTDIPTTIKRLGVLMGTVDEAAKSVENFNDRLAYLQKKYPAIKNKKTVFIQIWDKPLMSISGEHLISKIVAQCNGLNVFNDIDQLTISLDAETIIEKNPDVILVTRLGDLGQSWLARWRKWTFLSAVKQAQLFAVNPDYIVRHTPRVLDGIEQVCGFLQPEK